MTFFVFGRVKLISAGKVINSHQILSEQNLQNNQQIMAVILESRENLAENQAENAAYDRVQKAREDAQILINQKRHDFMQVSTQSPLIRFIYLLMLQRKTISADGRSKRERHPFTTAGTEQLNDGVGYARKGQS